MTTLWMGLMLSAMADPCGMVPPMWIDIAQPGIERTGLQQTWVFHRDGVQTIAIRPGFTGTVDEFGMLVPLPAVPSLRKIDDRTFDHLAAAVDAPVVDVYIQNNQWAGRRARSVEMAAGAMTVDEEMPVAEDQVVVVKTEAVGMYEVAVLEAGSPRALRRWMEDHDYRYPDGMEATVQDYVAEGWLFVAIKASVGRGSGVEPSPGMRSTNPDKNGAAFDGYVQGMAFRFAIDEPVVPMRLSTFNGDDTHNRVYMLTEDPVRITGLSGDLVQRQVRGATVWDNLTDPLELVVHSLGPLWPSERDNLEAQRDPERFSGAARDLIEADLLAASTGELSLGFEELEKELLGVGEALGMRGPELDALHRVVLDAERSGLTDDALADVDGMVLTVFDGDFDREHLQTTNLTFERWTMPRDLNSRSHFDLRPPGPQAWVNRSGLLPW